MQIFEETLFANRKTKEKNSRSNYPRTPLTNALLIIVIIIIIIIIRYVRGREDLGFVLK
jgi:hypothetical protein